MMLGNKKPRFVIGIDVPVICGLGSRDPEKDKYEEYKKYIGKMLNQFDNDFLWSIKYMNTNVLDEVAKHIDLSDRMYIDSGGFSLYKDEMKYGPDNNLFQKRCESMRVKLLDFLTKYKVKEVFELDNEYFRKNEDLLSPENYCRQEIFDIMGQYPTPVFKFHQGMRYWKNLCESPLYKNLSIGGLAQTAEWGKYKEHIKIMVEYAKSVGKKVHLLGCRNIEIARYTQPDSIDYSAMEINWSIKRAKAEKPHLYDETTKWKLMENDVVLFAWAMAKTRSPFFDGFDIDEL